MKGKHAIRYSLPFLKTDLLYDFKKNSYLLSFYFLFLLNSTFTRFPVLHAPINFPSSASPTFYSFIMFPMLLFSLLSLGSPIHFSVPLIFLPQFQYVPFCWTHISYCFLSALQLTQINLTWVNSHSTTGTTIHCGFISISLKFMCGRTLEVFYFNILFCIEHAQNSSFYLVPVSLCLFSWSYWHGPESKLQCSFFSTILNFSTVLLHKHWYNIPCCLHE